MKGHDHKPSPLEKEADHAHHSHEHHTPELSSTHEHHKPEVSKSSALKRAALEAGVCMVGCNIGDMPVMTALNTYTELPMIVAMGGGMVAGYSTSVLFETPLMKKHTKTYWDAFKMSAKMATLPIVAMLATENVADWAMGGQNYPFLSAEFMGRWAVSAAVGYTVALPIYYRNIMRGKGHQ